MPWTFAAFKDNDSSKVIDDVQEELDRIAFDNNTGNADAVSAKVALSNRQDGDAFAVVFFNGDITPQKPPIHSIRFLEKTFRVSGSNPEELYQEVRDQLNDLDDTEAFWAQVGLSDRKGGDTSITIYWPVAQS